MEADILKYVKVPLTDNQLSALVSFVYNVGIGAFASSTLLRKLNARDYVGAANELLRWDKGTVNGKKVVLRGLTIRRAKERAVFLKGDEFVSNSPSPLPQVKPAPPPVAPTPIVTPTQSHKTIWDYLGKWFGNG